MEGGIPSKLALEILKLLSPEDTARLSQTCRFWNAIQHLDWSNFCGKRTSKIFSCVPRIEQVVKRVLKLERQHGTFQALDDTQSRTNALERVKSRSELAIREKMTTQLEGYPDELMSEANQLLDEILECYCTGSTANRSVSVREFIVRLLSSQSNSHRSFNEIYRDFTDSKIELNNLKAALAEEEQGSEEANRLSSEIDQKEESLSALRAEMEENPALKFAEDLSMILLNLPEINVGEMALLNEYMSLAYICDLKSSAKSAYIKK